MGSKNSVIYEHPVTRGVAAMRVIEEVISLPDIHYSETCLNPQIQWLSDWQMVVSAPTGVAFITTFRGEQGDPEQGRTRVRWEGADGAHRSDVPLPRLVALIQTGDARNLRNDKRAKGTTE